MSVQNWRHWQKWDATGARAPAPEPEVVEPEVVEVESDDEAETVDRTAMQARAAELGVDVDKRWGIKRLAAEIAAVEVEA